jgi:hypothetical protein
MTADRQFFQASTAPKTKMTGHHAYGLQLAPTPPRCLHPQVVKEAEHDHCQ